MKFPVRIADDAEYVEVEGRRFSHYINNIRFWFIVHKGLDSQLLAVTHWDSGVRLVDVPFLRLQACRGDEVAAARNTLDALAVEKGEQRVYEVLRRAEKELNLRRPV
jgi:hypothetical protein